MPSVVEHATSPAPPEEVWKLLYDPSRFPEWWAGMERVELGPDADAFTFWFEGWPDHAMPQRLVTRRDGRRVTISCLVSFVELDWRLSEDGGGTRIDVRAAIPEEESARLEEVRAGLAESVRRLAATAATDAPPARG
jgi:uncharacterized protein YndB with AHSA1/START domain